MVLKVNGTEQNLVTVSFKPAFPHSSVFSTVLKVTNKKSNHCLICTFEKKIAEEFLS